MAKQKKIPRSGSSLAKMPIAVFLCASLLFLTAANFFVYADFHFEKETSWAFAADERQPVDPVEEHSKSCNGPTITEEYLHDKHFLHELSWLASSIHHLIADADKLTVIHYDIISPPPKV